MDDLRQRFAALDSVEVPNIWPEIERRSAQPVMRPQRVVSQGGPLTLTPGFIMFVVALLIAALATGLVAGNLLNQVMPPVVSTATPPTTDSPTPASSPTPSPLSLDCAAARASAARTTTGWPAGPAPANARNGWIATWGAGEVPEVTLVDPLTGEMCPLVRFPDYPTSRPDPGPGDGPRSWIPLRGPLVWSPSGDALAILVLSQVDFGPAVRAVYVWSELGLAGPLLRVEDATNLHVPSWSPDGSLLAVGQDEDLLIGSTTPPASVMIFASDGSPQRLLHADCQPCRGGPVYWSPNGEQIAFRAWSEDQESTSLGVAAGRIDRERVPLIDASRAGDALLGWASDQSLWIATDANRLFDMPISRLGEPVDLGRLPLDMSPYAIVLSPDGTQAAQVINQQPRGPVHISTTSFPVTYGLTLVANMAADGVLWWAPDGKMFGYLVDSQVEAQGIWVVNSDGSDHRLLVGAPLVVSRDLFVGGRPLTNVWQPRP